jgi:uncharacterized secreted protein with C-terminal beta-propeller domain
MAATIVTVSKIGESTTNIKIKVNDGSPVPSEIVTDTIQNFRTWALDDSHIFVWTNDQNQERSMFVPKVSIGWVVSSMPIGADNERFRIDSPCDVTVEDEVLV